MSPRFHLTSDPRALRLSALPLLPLLLVSAPLALAQEAPDVRDSEGEVAPALWVNGDTRTNGASTLTAEKLAEIERQDAEALARSAAVLPRVGASAAPREELENKALVHARAFERVALDTTARPGEVTAVGRGWKARFDGAGIEYTPRLGKAAPQSYPTSFELSRVTVGGEVLAFRSGVVRAEDESVTLERGSLREVYHLAADTIEQTFVFDHLVGAGDLVVQMAVDSAWEVIPGEEHIRFVSPTWGELRYGRAYALDADGDKIEITREWTGDGIALTVPAAFLAGATLPLTIDPVMGGQFTNTYGTTDDDSNCDVAYDSSSGVYWFVWQDYVSSTDSDVYASSINTAGTQGSTVIIDSSSNYWVTPAIAASPANSNLLVVASTTPNGPGSANAAIEGRFIDAATRTMPAAAFVIDQTTLSCVKPDVGGSWYSGASFADYCVVWEREWNVTDHDILARVVNSDGTFLTGTLSIANSGADDDYAPKVSKSRGDEAFNGDYWNIAWIRDVNQDGLGTPYFHRVYYDGTFAGATEQLAFNTALASNVDVTSTFDRAVPGLGERPFAITFQRQVNNDDIYATVCVQSGPLQTHDISILEDYDQALITRRPSIATNGTSFFLTFDELYWGASAGSTDFDTYGLSGNLAYGNGTAGIALSERHQRLQYTGGRQGNGVVSSRWDGGGATDDALMMWEDANGANGSTLVMQQFDSATADLSSFQAIGVQYCDANAHADSAEGGRRSSFISSRGSASVGASQQLWCTEMKLNAFSYFIVSQSTGNVNMPGASQGRLCLGGTIGRVVGGSILNTGASGTVAITFNPLVLPTPTGSFSASPGQTLYFQCWHRDTLGGAATSNFSNACAITFLP
ncbi:MAG: hypothetical protein R3F49_25385 [Planctomycetota bacterium]